MGDDVHSKLLKVRWCLDKALPDIRDSEPAVYAEEARDRLDDVLDEVSPIGKPDRDVPHCPVCGRGKFRETGPEDFISFLEGGDAKLTSARGYRCLECDTDFWVRK